MNTEGGKRTDEGRMRITRQMIGGDEARIANRDQRSAHTNKEKMWGPSRPVTSEGTLQKAEAGERMLGRGAARNQ